MRKLLDIAHLRVRFSNGFEALKDVSLSVAPGEIAGLVGESGSGKSMTALSILRLLPRNARVEGRILFAGEDILSLRPADLLRVRGRQIAYIPQEPMSALNPTLRTGTQLAMPLMMVDGIAKAEARARAAKALAEMHVADPERILDSYPFELSGGLRQRVLLANAFLRGPKLILADEPTTALDVTVQAEVSRNPEAAGQGEGHCRSVRHPQYGCGMDALRFDSRHARGADRGKWAGPRCLASSEQRLYPKASQFPARTGNASPSN